MDVGNDTAELGVRFLAAAFSTMCFFGVKSSMGLPLQGTPDWVSLMDSLSHSASPPCACLASVRCWKVGNVVVWRVGFGKELRYHEIEDRVTMTGDKNTRKNEGSGCL
jgi:hypothetical protein